MPYLNIIKIREKETEKEQKQKQKKIKLPFSEISIQNHNTQKHINSNKPFNIMIELGLWASS